MEENRKVEFNRKIKEECYAIQGAIFGVYRELGSGFKKGIYRECLSIELDVRSIPFVYRPEVQLEYRGEPLKPIYRPDFICYDSIIVEAVNIYPMIEIQRTRMRTYLKAAGLHLGLLANFGSYPNSTVERVVV